MTRDDLKEGMIIEERDGEKYFIRESGIVSTFNRPTDIYTYVSAYTYDLASHPDNRQGYCWGDIVRVYDKDMNLLWDRYVEERRMAEMIVKYRGNLVQFMKDYLGIKLTRYQEMMLKKILNEREK